MVADGSLRFVHCQFVALFANCENGERLSAFVDGLTSNLSPDADGNHSRMLPMPRVSCASHRDSFAN